MTPLVTKPFPRQAGTWLRARSRLYTQTPTGRRMWGHSQSSRVQSAQRPSHNGSIRSNVGEAHQKRIIQGVSIPAELCRMEGPLRKLRQEDGHEVPNSVSCRLRKRSGLRRRKWNRPLSVLRKGRPLGRRHEIRKLSTWRVKRMFRGLRSKPTRKSLTLVPL